MGWVEFVCAISPGGDEPVRGLRSPKGILTMRSVSPIQLRGLLLLLAVVLCVFMVRYLRTLIG